MGFLAKLLAPHVVGTPPEQGSSSSSPSSSSSVSSSQTAGSSSSISATAQPTAPPPPTIDTSSTAHLTPAQRQAKQLGLLLLGAGFMAASVGVTRRAVLRRQREAVPRFFHSSSSYLPASAADGSASAAATATLDAGERSSLAAQALGLATLNVAGFAVLLLGGTAWSFDLCSVAELQARTQMVMRRPGAADGLLDEQDEKEVDNMVVALMERLGMDVDELKEKDRRAAEAAQSMTPTTTTTTTTTTPKL